MLEGKLRAAVDALEAPTRTRAGAFRTSGGERNQRAGAGPVPVDVHGIPGPAERPLANHAYLIAAEDCYRGLAFENFVGTSSVVVRKAVLDVVARLR